MLVIPVLHQRTVGGAEYTIIEVKTYNPNPGPGEPVLRSTFYYEQHEKTFKSLEEAWQYVMCHTR